jgi:hypothetical protein
MLFTCFKTPRSVLAFPANFANSHLLYFLQVITDSAANCVKAKRIVQQHFLTISVAPCAAHCIDLCLEDIAKLDSCKDIFTKVSDVVKFFRSHSKLEQCFLKHSAGKKLLLPSSTRFKTNYIMGSCANQHRDAMCQCLYDTAFKDLLKDRDSCVKAGRIKVLLKDEDLWLQLEALVNFTAPICELLDFCNSQVCCYSAVSSIGTCFCMDKKRSDNSIMLSDYTVSLSQLTSKSR